MIRVYNIWKIVFTCSDEIKWMIALTEHKQDLVQLHADNCDLSYATQNGVNGLVPWGIMWRARNSTWRYVGRSSRWRGKKLGRMKKKEVNMKSTSQLFFFSAIITLNIFIWSQKNIFQKKNRQMSFKASVCSLENIWSYSLCPQAK